MEQFRSDYKIRRPGRRKFIKYLGWQPEWWRVLIFRPRRAQSKDTIKVGVLHFQRHDGDQ